MDKPKLEPSLFRDLMALLNECRKGDEWAGTHRVCERTGMGYMAARAKLLALVRDGYAESKKIEGVDSYRATEAGAELLR